MKQEVVVTHNRGAWDREVLKENPATRPIPSECIKEAKEGRLKLVLTSFKQIPASWLGDVRDKDILCLACGGGQQVPLLAAAGARVTSYDNSPLQLQRDRDVSEKYDLRVEAVLGDMTRLTFRDRSFDTVILGLGLQFVPDAAPVWRECARVLVGGGTLVGSVVNPHANTLDWKAYQAGELRVRHSLPYSDLESLDPGERARLFDPNDPIEFGHTMESLLGGLLEAGFHMTGFLEDKAEGELSSRFFATYYAFAARRV